MGVRSCGKFRHITGSVTKFANRLKDVVADGISMIWRMLIEINTGLQLRDDLTEYWAIGMKRTIQHVQVIFTGKESLAEFILNALG